MPENVHISLGRVQAAYDLNDEELYNLIQKLWERKQLFYNELWAETYEKYWQFAATGSLPYTQEKLPELPEPDSRHQSNFYPIFYGAQMVGYLAQLIKLVSYKPFQMGLEYLFETAFEDGQNVAAEERDILQIFRVYGTRPQAASERLLQAFQSRASISHKFYFQKYGGYSYGRP